MSNANNEISKEVVDCICLSATVIDSVFNYGKYYFSQAFLEECEYNMKEKKNN